MSGLPDLNRISDKALLDIYARSSLSLLLTKLFRKPRPSPQIMAFLGQVNAEISARGLDQNHGSTAKPNS